MPKEDKQRPPTTYTAAYTREFLDDQAFWKRMNPSLAERLNRLVKETLVSPRTGIGKPEALKNNLQGVWSRRLTNEHRLLYRVYEPFIVFVSARDHY